MYSVYQLQKAASLRANMKVCGSFAKKVYRDIQDVMDVDKWVTTYGFKTKLDKKYIFVVMFVSTEELFTMTD